LRRHELLVCLLFGALASASRGQDASWDLRNYHLYNAWALLHGRLHVDLAAAGIQSYFNPLADLPYYLLGTGPLAHLPRVLAAFQGLWFGWLIFLVLQIGRRLARLRGRVFAKADVCAAWLGITGTMVISQAGLSSNEVMLGCCVLLALYWCLGCCEAPDVCSVRWSIVGAGLLVGIAAGAKATTIVYVPALALALLLTAQTWGVAWRRACLFALVAGVGFLLAYGWWGRMLYRLTGNPVFPMFNQWFHSAWVPAAGNTDRQFLPRDVWQWLLYPFYWAVPNHHLVTEGKLAEPRYALAMLGVLVLAAVRAWRAPENGSCRRATRCVIVFVIAAYLAWLPLFSILRYTVPIVALCGFVCLWGVQALLDRDPDIAHARRMTTTMVALLVLSIAASQYPGWGHKPYATRAFDVHVPEIAQGSLVVLLGQPIAYVIPFFQDAAGQHYLGLTWFNTLARNDRLGALTRRTLRGWKGPLYILVRGDTAGATAPLRKLWLPGATFTACRDVTSRMERPRMPAMIRLCRLQLAVRASPGG
jgi:hypothetical protein